jgi:hypothetical protein
MFTVLQNGNVGIGTSSPIASLSLTGTGGIDPVAISSSSGSNLFKITQNSAVTFGTQLVSYQGVTGSQISHDYQVGSSFAGGSYRVAVNTGAGQTYFILYGSSLTNQFAIDGANNRTGIGSSSPSTRLAVQGAGTSDPFDVSSSSMASYFRVTSTGNIGIGTTSPVSTLSLTGTAGVNPVTIASSTGASLFTILQNGNVGIGTSSPTSPLYVKTGSSDSAVFESACSGCSRGITVYNNTSQDNSSAGIGFTLNINGGAVATYGAISGTRTGNTTGDLNFSTNLAGNLAVKMNLNSSGNLSIGNTSGASRLDITNSATSSTIITLRDVVGNISSEIRAGTSTLLNTSVGYQAGNVLTTGQSNAFFGYWAGRVNSIASGNSFFGYASGYSNTTGGANTFIGTSAGEANIGGASNTFIGNAAGSRNQTGGYNTALGASSQYNLVSGTENINIGWSSGYNNIGGNYNVMLGNSTGYFISASNNNTF